MSEEKKYIEKENNRARFQAFSNFATASCAQKNCPKPQGTQHYSDYTVTSEQVNELMASSPSKYENLKFQPLSSLISPEFWQELARQKINRWQLSDDPIPLVATFTGGSMRESAKLPPRLHLDNLSILTEKPPEVPKYYFSCPGSLLNMNKPDDFKALDKKKLLLETAHRIVQDIRNGEALKVGLHALPRKIRLFLQFVS